MEYGIKYFAQQKVRIIPIVFLSGQANVRKQAMLVLRGNCLQVEI